MLEQLKLLIRSGHSLLAIETRDEERAVEIVRQAAESLGRPLFEWSLTTGLVQTRPSRTETGVEPGKAAPALQYVLKPMLEHAIFVFKDLAPLCKDFYVQRQLRDIAAGAGSTLLLVDTDPLPDGVRRLAMPLKHELPNAEELESIVKKTYLNAKRESLYEITAKLTNSEFKQIVHTLRGLTESEARRVVSQAIFTTIH